MCKCNIFSWLLLSILVGAAFVILSVFSIITNFIILYIIVGIFALVLLGLIVYAVVNQCCIKVDECLAKVVVYGSIIAILAAALGILITTIPVLSFILIFFSVAAATIAAIGLIKLIFHILRERHYKSC